MVVKCFLPSELTEYLFTVNRAKSLANSVSMEWSYSELLELIGRRYGIYLTKHARHKVLGSNILDAIQLLKDKGGHVQQALARSRLAFVRSQHSA